MNHWLIKSEPDVYSIGDLRRDGRTCWEGVRNYQARNFMRDGMKKGDRVLFYHSNAEPPGAAGICRIVKECYPDFTAWDKKNVHYDPRSPKEKPVWMMVDVEFVEAFSRLVPLDELKKNPKLKGMMVTRAGMRLSVQPVDEEHFLEVIKRGGTPLVSKLRSDL